MMRDVGHQEGLATALVTGGSRGIGRAIAIELARSGNFVFINYQGDRAGAEQTLAQVREAGSDGALIQADVSKSDDVDRMFDAIEKARDGRLDILVNNAGITSDGLLTTMEEDDWRRVLSVNLDGAFRCTKRAVQAMLPRRYGRIVNLSSIMGQRPNKGLANYAASKGAIDSLTRAMATEVGYKGITVNAVAPGFVVTDMMAGLDGGMREERGRFPHNAVRRAGKPEEIAYVVGFLCSARAAFVNGQIIVADGGFPAVEMG
jgi:3-oxoacyl-[acyl-carrier protein] reductase